MCIRDRQKTVSECSETSKGDHGGDPPHFATPPSTGAESGGTLIPSNLATSLAAGEERPEHYLYDVDGVFAYTYYEKKPEMYDVEGKIRYK